MEISKMAQLFILVLFCLFHIALTRVGKRCKIKGRQIGKTLKNYKKNVSSTTFNTQIISCFWCIDKNVHILRY